MKKLFILATLLLVCHFSFGQDLSQLGACDYHFTTYEGSDFSTLDYLESGKVVFLLGITVDSENDWDYINTGTLKTFYNLYGPEGQDKVRLIVLLGEDVNNENDCLWGNSGGCPFEVNWIDTLATQDLVFRLPLGGTNILGCPDSVINFAQKPARATLPDGRGYYLSDRPSLLELQSLIPLLDPINGAHNAKLLVNTIKDYDHCEGENRTGDVWISNNGTQTLTQATIGLAWNGVEQSTINWTGSLESHKFAKIEDLLGSAIQMGDGDGALQVYIKSTDNGYVDPEKSNDTMQIVSLGGEKIDVQSAIVEWKTHSAPEMCYWDLINDDNEVLLWQGDSMVQYDEWVMFDSPYEFYHVYQYPVDLTEQGEECLKFRCFTYTGVPCGQWLHLIVEGDTIARLDDFIGTDHYDQRSINTTFPAPVSTHDVRTPIAIRPNPSNGEVWVSGSIPKAGMAQWSVCNSLGQVIATQNTNGQAGAIEAHFDTALWPDGIYFVTLQHEQSVATEMLRVLH